jgi:putative hydrolase of the HAD superfamily
MVNHILFDLSEVFLSGMKGIEHDIAPQVGIGPQVVRQHLRGQKLQELLKGKTTEDEYWNGVIAEGGYSLPAGAFKNIVRKNFHKEVPGAKEILEVLKQKGYSIGLLSDHVREWVAYIEPRFSFLGLFDATCYSFEIGVTKESPQSFAAALERMSADPETTLFIDDHQANLDVAKTAGIGHVHRFVDAAGLERELRARGIYNGQQK